MQVHPRKGMLMKKGFKAIFASVFAFALALAAVVPAYATSVGEGTADQPTTAKPTITVTTANPNDNLAAYKVLSVSVDSSNQLTYTYTDLFDAFLASAQYTASGVDADTPAKYMGLSEDNLKKLLGAFTAYIKAQNPVPAADKTATSNASGTATFTNVDMGQYIIVGVGGTGAKIYQTVTAEVVPTVVNGEYKLFSNYNVEMKVSEPTPEKEITGGTTTDGDLDTASVGDTVTYTLSATVPVYPVDAANTTFYMRDELSAGLTLKSTAAQIVVKGIAADDTETPLTLGTDYTVSIEGKFLYIDFVYDKIKSYAKVTATYDAVLNENAVTGISAGNPNTYTLIWSNDPYSGGSSTPHPTGPGYGQDDDTEIVYTYALRIYKYEAGSSDKPLGGAEFEIKDNNGNVIATIVTDDNGYAAYSGLEQGTYILHETKAPAGFKLMADQTITINKDNAIASVTTTTTVTYTTDINEASIKVQAQNAAGLKLWLTDGAQGETPEASATQPDGKVPAYVKTVTTTVVESGGTSGTAAEGYYSLDVPNEKGGDLPTTGGMGTVILYVVGGALVLGSAILMVAKKRMANSES